MQESPIVSSLEQKIAHLKNISLDKMFVAQKSIDYAVVTQTDPAFILLTKNQNIFQKIYNLSMLFILFLGIPFIIAAHVAITDNTYNQPFFIYSSVAISISLALLFISKINIKKTEQNILNFTLLYFENKFESLSCAEIHFVHNIEVEEQSLHDKNFWKQMQISEFIDWTNYMIKK